MNIKLYKSTSERIRVDKSPFLTEIASLNGTLRELVDLLSPSVVVELSPESYNIVTEGGDNVIANDSNVVTNTRFITTANYAYIPDFNRYYFIESIEISTSAKGDRRLYRLDLAIDVLMTYKDEILGLNLFIARNQYDFDLLLEDGILPMQDEKNIREYAPVPGSLVNVTFGNLSSGDDNIVVNVITDLPADDNRITPPAGSGLPSIRPFFYGSYGSSRPYAINGTDFYNISYNLMGDLSEKESFVKSAVAFPFKPSSLSKVAHIYLGQAIEGNALKDAHNNYINGRVCRFISEYLIVADFTIQDPTSFYQFAPWSHYEIYLPFLGWKEFDYHLLRGNRIIVFYTANYEDGSGDVYVWDYTNHRLLFSSSCQIGIKLAFSSTNAQRLEDQKNALGLNLGLGVISSTITGGMGIATGNVAQVAKGGMGLTSAIGDYAIKSAMLYENAKSSFSGGSGSLFVPLEVKIRITSPKPTISGLSDMLTYAEQNGRPLREYRTLRNLTGFTIAGGVIHLDNFLALEAEKTRIVQMLQNGIIL